jgi:hypothetical protein
VGVQCLYRNSTSSWRTRTHVLIVICRAQCPIKFSCLFQHLRSLQPTLTFNILYVRISSHSLSKFFSDELNKPRITISVSLFYLFSNDTSTSYEFPITRKYSHFAYCWILTFRDIFNFRMSYVLQWLHWSRNCTNLFKTNMNKCRIKIDMYNTYSPFIY